MGILDQNTREYVFSGTTAVESTIGAVGSGANLEIPGFTAGTTVGWFIRCADSSAVGLRWNKNQGAFTAAAGAALANYEDLPAGAGASDEVLHAGTGTQMLRVGPASVGTVTFSGRVLVRGA